MQKQPGTGSELNNMLLLKEWLIYVQAARNAIAGLAMHIRTAVRETIVRNEESFCRGKQASKQSINQSKGVPVALTFVIVSLYPYAACASVHAGSDFAML